LNRRLGSFGAIRSVEAKGGKRHIYSEQAPYKIDFYKTDSFEAVLSRLSEPAGVA
jgi:hypothetical protein